MFYWPKPASFCLFSFFSYDKYSTNLTINDKNIYGVLGTRTQGGRMVGADESTELWWHPSEKHIYLGILLTFVGHINFVLSDL